MRTTETLGVQTFHWVHPAFMALSLECRFSFSSSEEGPEDEATGAGIIEMRSEMALGRSPYRAGLLNSPKSGPKIAPNTNPPA
jgi:hypothetical protein